MPRRNLLPAVLTAAAMLLVWLSTPELRWPMRAWTTFLLTIFPVLIIAQASLSDQLLSVPRTAIYTSSIVMLWTLAAITGVIAYAGGVPRTTLGLTWIDPLWLTGTTIVVTLAGIALVFIVSRLGPPESPLLRRLLPDSAHERRVFIGLAVTAGITEEFVFRGFLIPVLAVATGQFWLAVIVSSGVFGVLHAYQQWAGAAAAATLGLLLAVPFAITGSILPAIIAHAAIDIIVGLWIRDRWRA